MTSAPTIRRRGRSVGKLRRVPGRRVKPSTWTRVVSAFVSSSPVFGTGGRDASERVVAIVGMRNVVVPQLLNSLHGRFRIWKEIAARRFMDCANGSAPELSVDPFLRNPKLCYR